MRRFLVAAGLLLALALSVQMFGQTTSQLSGTVQGASGAIPGVTLTATNSATGVETAVISNASGAYNFAALQPGTYTVRAELSSFRTEEVTNVRLLAGATNRLDFELEAAGAATDVEVSVSADEILLESSSSVGEVLEAEEIVDLPLVSNNVLDLIDAMAGVTRETEGFVLGIQGDFAGVQASDINVVRDGVSVSEQYWQSAGLNSTTVLHPDLVDEMKMILAPVDAETGRGNGQVQITTKSGGNEYHGGAVWNVKNTALDARTWADNTSSGGPPPQDWDNFNQYTASLGGPIVENKTFFFALWDQNIAKSRETRLAEVLTPCAQMGIYRWWDGWYPAAANASIIPSGNNPSRPSVDYLGNPLAPDTNPDGTPYSGLGLIHASIFGEVLNPPGTTAPDCSNAIIGPAPTGTGTWDPNRTGFDSSGFFDLNLSRAPAMNTWETLDGEPDIDGLNTAGHRWTRTIDGRDNLFGVGEPNPRKQINVNIDHIFNPQHELATSYTFEKVNADDMPEGWPDSYEGRVQRQPQVLSVHLTSTLSPNVVNEGRFGMQRQGTNLLHATEVPGTGEELLALLPKTVGGLPLVPQWTTGYISWSGENGGLVGARGGGPSASTVRDTNARWTFADTMSWTVGRHSLRFGGTYIWAGSLSEENGDMSNNSLPVFFLGDTNNAPNNAFDLGQVFRTSTGLDQMRLTEDSSDDMADLLLFLSGSLGSVDTARFINSPEQVGTEWNDPIAGELVAIRELRQNEINAFFKDDWKVTDNLTLNLGLRWDYYGVPYDKNGMTMSIVGGSDALFGRSGTGFESWMSGMDIGSDVAFQFIGPNSPNPDFSAYERDLNNFGPAVGFSYNVPWLGEDRTIFRGGYQASFLGGGNGDLIKDIIQTPPGSLTRAEFNGLAGGDYFDLADVIAGVGMPPEPAFLPVEPVPVTDRGVALTVFDSNYRTPYIQNLTASLTHRFNSQVTVDAKYVATLSRKQAQTFNINVPNLFGNGLFEALRSARAGGDPVLLDELFMDVTFAGLGTVDGVNVTGGDVLREFAGGGGFGGWRNSLADGDFETLADSISLYNYDESLNPGLPPIATGETGGLLRYSPFPENWIHTSPQFSSGSGFGQTGAAIRTNLGHQNYHSMQSSVTLRPTYGIQLNASYTWAKSLDRNGPFTIPWDRASDYRINGVAHNFRGYGTFNLPIGPSQLLFGNSSGTWARIAEGWQMSWIYGASSGQPINLESTAMLYNNSEPVLVGSFPTDGEVHWEDGAPTGSFWDINTERRLDPQCSNPATVAPSIAFFCDRQALYDADTDELIFRTPVPGEVGTFRDVLRGVGTWTLDMAISKRTQLTEDISMDLRVDASNIFNHPTPSSLGTSIQGGDPVGELDNKTGSRVFQLKARIDF